MSAHTLRSGDIAVTITPDLGARITSLRVGDTEWIGQPGTPPVAADVGSDFVRDGLGGWDEMLPTITGFPDHGEVWARAWNVDQVSETALTTSVRLKTTPLTMVRTVTVDERAVIVDYTLGRTVSNAGDMSAPQQLSVLWAAHPLLRASEVRLPSHVRGLLDVMPNGTPTEMPVWVPIQQALLRLDALPVGGFVKYYVPFGVPVSSVTVVNRDGDSLEWSWTRDVPYLGIWMDRNAFGPGEVIAPEPCTAAWDDLGRASRLGMAFDVPPGRPRRWRIEVRPDV